MRTSARSWTLPCLREDMTTERRGKPPHNVQVLQRWVGERAKATGVAQQRLQRWISFMVVAAVLDSIRDEDDDPVFALKGGVAVELRLGPEAGRPRTTTSPTANAPATCSTASTRRSRMRTATSRSPAPSPSRSVTPAHSGSTSSSPTAAVPGAPCSLRWPRPRATRAWRSTECPRSRWARSAWKGQPTWPASPFATRSRRSCTPARRSTPTGRTNDRFRDLCDVLLLRDLIGDQDLVRVRDACIEIFALRAKHSWPPTVTIFAGWAEQYAALAEEIDFEIRDVDEAAIAIQALIAEIDAGA
jgi:hypothetical protein